MANDDQDKPLTPTTSKSQLLPVTAVDEALSTELRRQHQGFHNRTVCCGIIAAIFLIVAVVMLVLGFTVFHVTTPKIRMDSVMITGLDRVNLTNLLTVNENLTAVADVSIKNTNVAAFKFEKSNTNLFYHKMVVGVADIPAGIVKARRTMRLNVTVELMVAEIARNPLFGSDLIAGILRLESSTKINGKVKILDMVKRKVIVSMNCSIDINVSTKEIKQNCKRHVIR